MWLVAGLEGFLVAPGVLIMLFVAGLANFFSCTKLIRNVACSGIFSCTRQICNVACRVIGSQHWSRLAPEKGLGIRQSN